MLEEVSLTHTVEDSFYTDPAITANEHRKSLLIWLVLAGLRQTPARRDMKTIAWDVDDVLNECMRTWLKPRGCPPIRAGRSPTRKSWRIRRAASSAARGGISRLARRVPPVGPPGRCSRFRRSCIGSSSTARSCGTWPSAPCHCRRPISAAWVFCHFGRWIRSFHFFPRRTRANPALRSLERRGVATMGNDRRVGGRQSRQFGLRQTFGNRTFCFPRPWNQGPRASSRFSMSWQIGGRLHCLR